MIINRQYQYLTQNSSISCYFLNINWFHLADTASCSYWVITQNADFSNSVEILKDLLSSSLTTLLEKLTTSGASLTQTFQVDSGVTGFNALANLNIRDTVYSTDASATSYSLSSSFVKIIDGTRSYYAEVCVGDDISLTHAQKYGDGTAIVSYPNGGINTLTIYTTDVGISFDFLNFTIDSGDGSLDAASKKLLSKNRQIAEARRNVNCRML